MKKSKLDGKIEEIPLFETIDVFTRRYDGSHVEQDDFQAIVEKDDDEAIAVVSDRYNLVQIRDVFREAVETVTGAAEYGKGELDAHVYYQNGRGELEVYPSVEGKNVGLLIKNSVDKTYALQVDFCTKVDGDTIVVPNVDSFKRFHTCKNADMEVEEYLDILSEVSNVWEEIVEELGQLNLTREDVEALGEELSLGKEFEEKLEQYENNGNFVPLEFWEFIQMALRHIQRNRYKSDIHYRKKVRKVADTILHRAVAERLKASSSFV